MKSSVLLAALLFILGAGSLARAFPPYYDISDHARAEAEARQRNLPLAWLGSFPECLTIATPNPGSIADLTQMALATLQGHAVVIFFDGRNMAPVPDIIHAQYHIQDDGPLPNGANWTSPKVVFSNPEVTKILGRVSYTEMKADRDIPLNSALQVIRNDPTALAPPPPAEVTAATAPAAAPNDSAGNLASVLAFVSWASGPGLYLTAGIAVVLIFLLVWIARTRRPS